MSTKKQKQIQAIFVDCFDTIILRNTSKSQIFKNWAQTISAKYNIPWKTVYKAYKNINFNLCFKKLFTSLTLQENFEVVLEKLFCKLVKKYTNLEQSEFISFATETYFQKELESFTINKTIIDFLQEEKNKGTKIYLVSDFYCKSDTLSRWFVSLKINNIFEQIFSSSDFNKEKATTKLYKKLIKLLNLNAKNVIMFGDNLWSDVLMAKTCGLNAKRVSKNITKEKLCKSKN